MSDKKYYIFTYGTLKKGCCRNYVLKEQEFIAEAITKPVYKIYTGGSYPCLVEDKENGIAIQGEVYRVDEATMKRLDMIEGVPTLYKRHNVKLDNFPEENVIAYLYQNDVSYMEDCGNCWQDR